jgi:pantothenate kinase
MTAIGQLAERATSLLATGRADGRPGRVMLGITGPPGAGKSTLATALIALIPCAAVVGMDGFHIADAELTRLGLRTRKGAPDTFDRVGYAHLLQRLRADRAVVFAPVFHRSIEDSIAAEQRVGSDVELVISEGNYLLNWPEVAAQFDEVWYLDPPHAERVQALVQRHIAFGKAPDEAAVWAAGSDESNATFVAEARAHADLVIGWPSDSDQSVQLGGG